MTLKHRISYPLGNNCTRHTEVSCPSNLRNVIKAIKELARKR